MNSKQMEEAILALQQQVGEMAGEIAELREQIANGAQKPRGPKSDRSMKDADAYRVKYGDLKDKNHKEAAETLGLSYGQVFSARGGYTFKHVKAGMFNDDGSAKPQAAQNGGAK